MLWSTKGQLEHTRESEILLNGISEIVYSLPYSIVADISELVSEILKRKFFSFSQGNLADSFSVSLVSLTIDMSYE